MVCCVKSRILNKTKNNSEFLAYINMCMIFWSTEEEKKKKDLHFKYIYNLVWYTRDSQSNHPPPPRHDATNPKQYLNMHELFKLLYTAGLFHHYTLKFFFRLFSKDHNKAMNYALYIHIPLCQIRKGKYQSADWVVSTE